MTKTDVLREISNRTQFAKGDIGVVLDAYQDFILDTLKENKEEKIPFGKIGKFSVKHCDERTGKNVLGGGGTWTKPAHDEIKFVLSKTVKEL